MVTGLLYLLLSVNIQVVALAKGGVGGTLRGSMAEKERQTGGEWAGTSRMRWERRHY